MTEALFLLNSALTALLLVEGFRLRTGYLQVPFLSALIYAIWYLPQAGALLDDPTLPDGSLARVLAMSLLCLLAIWAGWRQGGGGIQFNRKALDVPVDRLIWPTFFLTVFAASMRAAILAQPDEVRAASQWTGPITIIAFFMQVGTVSLVLSLALVLRRRSIATMALAGANLFLYAAPLLIYFRRADTFQFIFGALLCLFFILGKKIPRTAIVAGVVVGFAFVNGVGNLRSLSGAYALDETGKIETRIPALKEISEIDWFDFQKFYEDRLISETRNAAIYMMATDSTNSVGFGSELWNQLVHAYIPGQIVGFDLKQSFKIGEDLTALAFRYGSYEPHTGTTSTGFPQPYRDFWYFGAATFFLVAWFMARQFAKAHAGKLKSLTMYAVLLPLSIHGITHDGYQLWVYAPLPLLAIWLAFRFRRMPPLGKPAVPVQP